MSENTKWLEYVADGLGKYLEGFFRRRIGFCLLVYPYGEELKEIANNLHYMSNSPNRDEMARLLEEAANRLENYANKRPPQGNA